MERERVGESFAVEAERFLEASVRRPVYDGISYPAEPDELVAWVDQILAGPPRLSVAATPPPRVVLAPHLDLRVESAAYGLAYQCLRGRSVQRIVLLGTGHDINPADGLFSLSHKAFATPLGTFSCDTEAVAWLRQAGGALCVPDDLAHKDEHALEFQLPFLQRTLTPPMPRIVPILCGSMFDWMMHVRRPAEIPKIGSFLEALRTLCQGDTLVVLGVDLSHIGLKFGHTRVARRLYPAAQTHDRRLLDALCRGDVSAFWARNQEVLDFFHVCGFSAIALLLEALPGLRGQILRHDFWFEEETFSAVSFAAAHLF